MSRAEIGQIWVLYNRSRKVENIQEFEWKCTVFIQFSKVLLFNLLFILFLLFNLYYLIFQEN